MQKKKLFYITFREDLIQKELNKCPYFSIKVLITLIQGLILNNSLKSRVPKLPSRGLILLSRAKALFSIDVCAQP